MYTYLPYNRYIQVDECTFKQVTLKKIIVYILLYFKFLIRRHRYSKLDSRMRVAQVSATQLEIAGKTLHGLAANRCCPSTVTFSYNESRSVYNI